MLETIRSIINAYAHMPLIVLIVVTYISVWYWEGLFHRIVFRGIWSINDIAYHIIAACVTIAVLLFANFI